MNFNEISFKKLKEQVDTFLSKTYKKSGLLYRNISSPFGQVLSVIENLFSLSMLYMKNSIQQFDMSEANENNDLVVKNTALVSGHIPFRAISSTGTLKMTLKNNSDVNSGIIGNRVTILNKSRIRNRTNNLDYSINIGNDKQSYSLSTDGTIFIPIIQGRWQTVSFTGTNDLNQTFHINNRSGKDIENYNYEVYVDGELWGKYESLYDMNQDEKGYLFRTGFDGGVDLIFGNGSFGKVPELGANITVMYLESDGSKGSIFRRTLNDFTFLDSIIDMDGMSVEVDKNFIVEIYTDINFGSDKESIEFTKSMIPMVSKNYVLGTPKQYAYHIKKLGIFSHVNAYKDNNSVAVVVTPNINNFKASNSTYFDIDLNAFYLDKYEQKKLLTYLTKDGSMILSNNIRIENAKLSFYSINVFIMTTDDSTYENVENQIIETLSNFFMEINYFNRIPKSVILSELNKIDGIASVEISFVSKKNEDYHKEQLLIIENNRNNGLVNELNNTYNPNISLGIDPLLGDILFEPHELPILRGGFHNRNGILINDSISGSGLKAVNIYHKGKVKKNNI